MENTCKIHINPCHQKAGNQYGKMLSDLQSLLEHVQQLHLKWLTLQQGAAKRHFIGILQFRTH